VVSVQNSRFYQWFLCGFCVVSEWLMEGYIRYAERGSAGQLDMETPVPSSLLEDKPAYLS
jgi:hypothetical protein